MMIFDIIRTICIVWLILGALAFIGLSRTPSWRKAAVQLHEKTNRPMFVVYCMGFLITIGGFPKLVIIFFKSMFEDLKTIRR